MNKQQHQHMIEIQTRFMTEHSAKYRAGTVEHKTNLGADYDAKTLLKYLKEEVLDLVSYVYTLEEYMERESE